MKKKMLSNIKKQVFGREIERMLDYVCLIKFMDTEFWYAFVCFLVPSPLALRKDIAG